jgi:hypothetical protein
MRALWLVALAACSSSMSLPPPSPIMATLVVDGDLVVRGESDGSISVMARVVHEDKVAFGVVRLLGADMSAAASSPHVALARARAWQTLAHMDPTHAVEAARRGAEQLPACPRGADDLVARMHCYVESHHGDVW